MFDHHEGSVMSIASVQFARRVQPAMSKISPDRRRHKRVGITLLGRFMRANKLEYPCKLNDISVGGASIMSPVVLRDNERVIAYFDQVGGIEGTVARLFEGGFAMKIVATQNKREKLAAQLTWLLNRHEMQGADDRKHERVTVPPKMMPLKLNETISVECRVLDFSLSGAAVETTARPHVGAEVVLGRLRALVVRHHETGVGLQFLDIQPPDVLRRVFG